MITAGWRLQYRVHGALVEDGPHAAEIAPRAGSAGPRYRVRAILSTDHAGPERVEPRVEVPLFLPHSEPIEAWVRFAEASSVPRELAGAWLTIDVLGEFPLEHELEGPFATIARGAVPLSSDDAVVVERVATQLRGQLRREARARGETAAAALNAAMWRTALELWAEAEVYVLPDGSYRLQRASDIAEGIPPLVVTGDMFHRGAFAATAAAYHDPEPAARLAVAAHWYLRAWQERPGSMERFLAFFTVLEVLIRGFAASPAMSPEVRVRLDALETLSADDAALLAFVKQVESKFTNPTLTAQFRELAKQYSAATENPDVARFSKLNKERNSLLHAGQSAIPEVMRVDGDDVNTFSAVQDLAARYVALVLNDIARAENGRIRVQGRNVAEAGGSRRDEAAPERTEEL